jgi:hypothetical protein
MAAVLLHWPPAVFWAATSHEYWAAMDMWREIHPPRGKSE